MFKIKRLLGNKVVEGSFVDLNKKNIFVWLDIINPNDLDLHKVSNLTQIVVSDLKDYLDYNRRPTFFQLKDYSVVVISVPILENEKISTSTLIALLSKKTNDFITIHRQNLNSIDKINSYTNEKLTQCFKKGPVYLLYRIMDEIFSEYFSYLDNISDELNNVEAKIFSKDADKGVLNKIFKIKKILIYFYKSLLANRDVVYSIENEFGTLLKKEDLIEFRRLYSDLNELTDLSSTYREIISSNLESYMSHVSNNLNITMKKLSAWGALILVPTLIAGLYGMNFKFMPALVWEYGFFMILAVMVVAVTSLYLYFHKNDWI